MAARALLAQVGCQGTPTAAKEQTCGPAKDRDACVWPLGVIAGSFLRTQHTEHPVSAHIWPSFERPPHKQMGGEGLQPDFPGWPVGGGYGLPVIGPCNYSAVITV